MVVTVLYFATLRDRAGVREEKLTLPDGAVVTDLLEAVQARHSQLEPAIPSTLVSINREYAFAHDALQDGDEVALFPPVSGGEDEVGPTIFRITRGPLDLNAILEEIILPSTGAACVFTGVVRGRTEREGERITEYLEYEAYEPMAKSKMSQVADEIRQRWPSVAGIAILQRVGRLSPGTPTVLIACTSGHRDSGAFEAARYGIDRLKEIVPIWKKEFGPETEEWIVGEYHPTEDDRQQ
ncbi:MAG: molybdopterin converting factor subunit 1 [Anaerolineales bacterium]|nr:molybdopterin converting factor subunit 1 [Anaerolineales bacterium]